jgi:hypothetical protein
MDEQHEAAPDLEVPDQPADDVAPVEAETTEERFTDLDPAEAPEGEITAEWLQERYKQMQADYTRKRQAEAETAKQRAEELEFLEALRTDREVQQAVLEQLQEVLSDEEMEELYEDLDEDATPETDLERQVRELAAIEQQRQAQHLASQVVDHIESLAKGANVELDEDDLRDIFDAAISGDEVNGTTTEQAFKDFHARQQAKHDKWLKSYLASKQPAAQIPSGQSGTEKVDLSNADNRIARMAAIMQGS